jgi:hypothetical protein
LVKGEGDTVRKKAFEGKCYNFALGFVNDWLLKQGHWTPEEAMAISGPLSKEVQKTVTDFLERQRQKVDHLIDHR